MLSLRDFMEKSEILTAIQGIECQITAFHQNLRESMKYIESRVADFHSQQFTPGLSLPTRQPPSFISLQPLLTNQPAHLPHSTAPPPPPSPSPPTTSPISQPSKPLHPLPPSPTLAPTSFAHLPSPKPTSLSLEPALSRPSKTPHLVLPLFPISHISSPPPTNQSPTFNIVAPLTPCRFDKFLCDSESGMINKRKVFEKMTERKFSSSVCGRLAWGESIHVYMEETMVELFFAATLLDCFEKISNEKIMGFDPGGGNFDALFHEVGLSLFELFSASGFQEKYRNRMRGSLSSSCNIFCDLVVHSICEWSFLVKIAVSFNSWAPLDAVISGVLDVFRDEIVEQDVVIFILKKSHLAEDLPPSIGSIFGVPKLLLDNNKIFNRSPYEIGKVLPLFEMDFSRGFCGEISESPEYIGVVGIKKLEISERDLFAAKNDEGGLLVLVTFLVLLKELIHFDSSSYRSALYLWKQNKDIPGKRWHHLILSSLLNPRRHDQEDCAGSLELWNSRTSSAPLLVCGMCVSKKAIFCMYEQQTLNLLSENVNSFDSLCFSVRHVHEVISMEQPCGSTYEFGDGKLNLLECLLEFLKPVKHAWPCNYQVVNWYKERCYWCYSDVVLRNDAVARIFNISIDDINTGKIVEESTSTISFLSSALRSENIETKSYVAVALSTLWTMDPNKVIMGEAGASKCLIKLLEKEHPLALRDVASTILNSCPPIKNRKIVNSEGAVTLFISMIKACVLINEMVRRTSTQEPWSHVCILILIGAKGEAYFNIAALIICLDNWFEVTSCECNCFSLCRAYLNQHLEDKVFLKVWGMIRRDTSPRNAAQDEAQRHLKGPTHLVEC